MVVFNRSHIRAAARRNTLRDIAGIAGEVFWRALAIAMLLGAWLTVDQWREAVVYAITHAPGAN